MKARYAIDGVARRTSCQPPTHKHKPARAIKNDTSDSQSMKKNSPVMCKAMLPATTAKPHQVLVQLLAMGVSARRQKNNAKPISKTPTIDPKTRPRKGRGKISFPFGLVAWRNRRPSSHNEKSGTM